MSNHCTVTGGLLITPALDQAEIDTEGYGESSETHLILYSKSDETVGIKPDGTIGIIGDSYTMAEPRYDTTHEADYTAVGLKDEVQRVAQLCADHGSSIEGFLLVSGEEHLDLWRIRVEATPDGGGSVHEEHPKLLWPNGEIEEL